MEESMAQFVLIPRRNSQSSDESFCDMMADKSMAQFIISVIIHYR
jgi:hypothetical protein